jgi:tRNA-2-methylthio-N6-dimethylallyladenosine synthase
MDKKYHIVVHGCQMNVADAEKVSAVLERAGYKKTSDIKKANLVAVVMCSVRQAAVDRIFGLAEKIRKLKAKNYKLKAILTGCILKKDKKTFSGLFDHVMDMNELVNSQRTSQGNKLASEPINFFEARETPYAGYPRTGRETKKNLIGERAYITISNGCNNFCTYCVVPYTRGRLNCIDHKKIIAEAKKLIKRGYKEIWLLGQNVNDYTSPTDKSVKFPDLLKLVCNLPGNFKVFFMSPNPKNFSDELIKVMAKSKKYSRYLNLPVQAGDDEILKRMNRPYTAKKYLELVKKIRKAIPDINLSTDVIVGFPGETKKQFENTVKLFKKAKFNIAYINKYSPRKGTAAFNIKDDVPFKEKKRREQILIKLVNEPR